jgi:hypothetical protein
MQCVYLRNNGIARKLFLNGGVSKGAVEPVRQAGDHVEAVHAEADGEAVVHDQSTQAAAIEVGGAFEQLLGQNQESQGLGL